MDMVELPVRNAEGEILMSFRVPEGEAAALLKRVESGKLDALGAILELEELDPNRG